MKYGFLLLLVYCATLTACAVTQYTLVTPGVVAIQDLEVKAGTGWNSAPPHQTRLARRESVSWTRDGLLLDRLVIIPGVPDGEPLLVTREQTAAMPVFRADMLPNEIEELVESTIVKFFGEGQAVVNTENLRPHRFGNERGVLFDLSAIVTESPEYKGLVGAFVADDRLYVMYFLAATPHYYDKHIAEAEAIIKSATLAEAVS